MTLPSLKNVRQRFNQLAAAVGEGRELSRQTLSQLETLSAELLAEREHHRRTADQLQELSQQFDAAAAEQHQRDSRDQQFQISAMQAIRRVHADEAYHRRLLRELRETEAYEQAFADPTPLVSVVIPTFTRLELLRGRAIPSILAQDHTNLEIVVVGDHSEFGAAEVTAGFERAPIRFANRTVRGPYPADPERRWMVAGGPPFNEALAMARGDWIAPFADDDAMRPHHLSTLLAAARADRLEFVYGRFQLHPPAEAQVLGIFPPQLGQIGLQAALLHRALNVFELELADADFGIPSDWARIERMLWAGVRVGMVDEILADYYPGMLAQEK